MNSSFCHATGKRSPRPLCTCSRGFSGGWHLAVGIILVLLSVPSVTVAQSSDPPGVFLQVIPHHDLQFGTAVQGDGPVAKFATDRTVAKFEVRAQLPPDKKVTITIEPPEYLENGSDNIPYQLRAAYNTHTDDPSTATEISGLTATFLPQADETYDHAPRPFPEASAYIYVYGTATIEYQPSGTYSGPITLKAHMTH